MHCIAASALLTMALTVQFNWFFIVRGGISDVAYAFDARSLLIIQYGQ